MECDAASWDYDITREHQDYITEYVVSANAKRLSLSLHTVSCLHLTKFPHLAQVRA